MNLPAARCVGSPMRPFALAVAVLLSLAAAAPCLWDHDTLAQERARFPTALELITGKFPRHSEAYWRWRIEDRTARMDAGESTPELYDDLAVAHEKLGDHERAIALMHEKEALHPGLYETAANHGTFLIHAGRFEEGADEIARAITINPDAHFGREVYQELLVRYVLAARTGDGPSLPLNVHAVREHFQLPNGEWKRSLGYWGHVERERKVIEEHRAKELELAAKGVLGMLRFGNHDSPVLLEVLSDLLLVDRETDAKRLAARALLKASYEVDDDAARLAFRTKATSALSMQTPRPDEYRSMKLEEIEAMFADELAEAEAWYAELVINEQAWIEAGEDVDARFRETYLAPVRVASPLDSNSPATQGDSLLPPVLGAIAALFVVGWIFLRTRSPRRRPARRATS